MYETLTSRAIDYLFAAGGAFLLTLILTPIVREVNRRVGMVDKPDPRRINKVPIPRGGGIALFLGVIVSYTLFAVFSGRPALFQPAFHDNFYVKYVVIASFVVLLGLVDDRFSLPAKVKLLGQLLAGLLVWWWGGVGFVHIWPDLPAWIDCLLTVVWITGAINAFNLIDGLDGLASGLALIASVGMAGALFLVGKPQAALFYFAFGGGLLGFLRYNYNPASVFLGDSGSMFIGFTLAVIPLVLQSEKSFLVSVGVPLLAMGVPIFDTALAILRRSIRRLIQRRNASEQTNGEVMTADSDHLHHRILRAAGLNQRKAAWILYAMATFAVSVGLVGMYLSSRAAGLWLFAIAAASVLITRDMARIELFDAGRLLSAVAHDRKVSARRRWARLSVPFYFTFDAVAVIFVFFLSSWVMNRPLTKDLLRVEFPLRTVLLFVGLVFFRTYRTVWSRAMTSNYLRLALACVFGSVFGTVAVYYAPRLTVGNYLAFTLLYATLSFILLMFVRFFRSIVRDAFYAMDCSRLVARKDVSRVLVYGAGLRYKSFRRELVRRTSSNNRVVVGLLDDDLLLNGQYIGGIRVLGMIQQAPEIINRLNVDTVVIACEVSDEWMKVILQHLKPTGVKVMLFTFEEKQLV